MCARANGRRNGYGQVCAQGSGTRTIYLYTVDWTVCSHCEEKVEEVVRGCEGEGEGEVSAEMCV